MPNLLGTVSAQIKIDVTQAVAAYVKVQRANRDTITALRGVSSTLNTVGNALGVVGVGIALGLGAAAKAAADFNAQMSYFQAISGATVSQMEQIKQKALELDQTTMFSTTDIANMFVELAKAGESTSNIVGGVADAVVNLAQAAQIPLNSAVTTVVAVLNAYNLSAAQAADVSNRLAGAANASILEVSDLATSLKYVSGVANQLGISFDETTTALDLLGNAGIKGSMGGTELRQILVSLLGTTKAGAAELEKLGIITKSGANQFFEASGKAKSLSDVFQILQDHLKGLNQEQQLAALKILFNNRALAAASILTRDGAKGFAEMNAQISGTSAADVAAKRMDNLSGDVKKLTSSIKTMAIQAGQPLQQFLRSVVQDVTALVHWFENLSPATQSNIIHFIAFTAATLLLTSALVKLVAFALSLGETFTKLAEAAKFLWEVVSILGEAIAAVGAAILASPIAIIVAVVLALAAAFYLLYEKVKPVRDFFDMLGRGLRTAFEATVNWFKTLPAFFEHVWADIKQWFSDGVQAVEGAWNSVVNFFTGIGESIKNGVESAASAVVNFFESLPGKIGRALDNVGNSMANFFNNLPYKLGYWLGKALGTIIRWSFEAGQKIGEWLVSISTSMSNFFTNLPARLAAWLVRAATAIEAWVEQTKQDIGQWLIDAGVAIEKFFTILPGRLAGWLVQAATALKNFEVQAVADVASWIVRTSTSIANFFESLPARVAGWLERVITNIINWGNNAANWAGQIGLNFVNGILNFLNQLPGLAGQVLDNVITAFKNMIGDAWNAAKGFAKGLWDGFKSGLGISSPSYIERAITKISGHMMTETDKIGSYVKKINGLGQQMMDMNPAIAASVYSSVLGPGKLTEQMKMAAEFKQLFGSSLPAGYTLTSAAGFGNGGINGLPVSNSGTTKVVEVNVYNPVAEQSSTSVTQELRTLASMGAF